MNIKYVCSTWGQELSTLEATLARIKSAGFDGVEIGVPVDAEERRQLGTLLRKLELDLVAQQWTAGKSPAEHARSFEEQYRRGIELHPLFVNSHTGKDYYTTAENLEVFARARALEQEAGVRVVHETHRGRATFSAPATRALIDAMPDLRLAADFSHWCCVHESMLEDQHENLEHAVRHSSHIHARVGHPEGPQVTDPRAPEWHDAVETHLRWWQSIVDHERESGAAWITICPEFGPPGYMVVQPYTRQPMVNLWETNCHMKDLLRNRLRM